MCKEKKTFKKNKKMLVDAVFKEPLSNKIIFVEKKKLLFLIFLKFFFKKFSSKIEEFVFSLIFFLYYWPAIILEIQKWCIYSIVRNTPILICIFLYFKIAYFPSAKSEKSKKLNFFVHIVCTPKIFLWDNSLMLCCSPNIFSWFFETFLVLKFLSQNFFSRKKGWTTEMSKKKKKKKWKMADFRKSAGIWVQYLGRSIFGY